MPQLTACTPVRTHSYSRPSTLYPCMYFYVYSRTYPRLLAPFYLRSNACASTDGLYSYFTCTYTYTSLILAVVCLDRRLCGRKDYRQRRLRPRIHGAGRRAASRRGIYIYRNMHMYMYMAGAVRRAASRKGICLRPPLPLLLPSPLLLPPSRPPPHPPLCRHFRLRLPSEPPPTSTCLPLLPLLKSY